MSIRNGFWILITIALLLQGCAGSRQASVSDQDQDAAIVSTAPKKEKKQKQEQKPMRSNQWENSYLNDVVEELVFILK